MAKLADASQLAKVMPLPAVQKLGVGEGEVVHPFDLSFTWKVKGADTGFLFSVYEMTIKPGGAIPIHVHPFAEFFYVLQGTLDAMGLDGDGRLTWTSLAAGDSANAPAGAAHGVKNRSGDTAKFLSVASFEHEQSFNDYQLLLKTQAGQAMSQFQKSEAIMDIFASRKIIFLDAKDQGPGS